MKDFTQKRRIYNRLIIRRLSRYLRRNPDIRFGQALWNLGILKKDASGEGIMDPYYAEPDVIYKLMRKG